MKRLIRSVVCLAIAAATALFATGGPLDPADTQEGADAQKLVQYLNVGDFAAVSQILRAHGADDVVVRRMEAVLTNSPPRIGLVEPFLKAVIELPLGGRATNVQTRLNDAGALGYSRPVWPARWPETNWATRCDIEIDRCPTPPIALFNVLKESEVLQFYKWYDRYADRLHSVILNEDLSNAKLDDGYDQANRLLNALYRLIKARKPEAFVWLRVVKQEGRSDERWLKAMRFKPDGLQISNLRQFHSPFGETRRRYLKILGEDIPMMVEGFYGYKEALQARGKELSAAKKINDPTSRASLKAEAIAQLGGIGGVVGQDLDKIEELLQTSGYRGLSVHLLLIEALSNLDKAEVVGRSDMVDSRAAWLDRYYAEKDFSSMSKLSSLILSESAPGDMNWTVAKLYEGIALLSQPSPNAKSAAATLDEVLNFDFTGRPGRDHYIIGAVKWRMHAAVLSNDAEKTQELVRWVRSQEFRADLKASFFKQLGIQESLAPAK